MYTLSAQIEQRAPRHSGRLDVARELLIGFAIVNGRLPCPATAASKGDEAPAGGACTNYLNGFLPATAIGFRPVDSAGYAVDAWGNRLRYAIARTATEPGGTTTLCHCPGNEAFSVAANLKANGVNCAPPTSSFATRRRTRTPPSRRRAAERGELPATRAPSPTSARWWPWFFRPGRTRRWAARHAPTKRKTRTDDGVFVWHDLRPAGATGGEYDDLVVWLPVEPALRPADRRRRAALSRRLRSARSRLRRRGWIPAPGDSRSLRPGAPPGTGRCPARCASSPARAARSRRLSAEPPRRCRTRAARRARRIRDATRTRSSASPARLASALRIRLSATLSNSERGSRTPARRLARLELHAFAAVLARERFPPGVARRRSARRLPAGAAASPACRTAAAR